MSEPKAKEKKTDWSAGIFYVAACGRQTNVFFLVIYLWDPELSRAHK